MIEFKLSQEITTKGLDGNINATYDTLYLKEATNEYFTDIIYFASCVRSGSLALATNINLSQLTQNNKDNPEAAQEKDYKEEKDYKAEAEGLQSRTLYGMNKQQVDEFYSTANIFLKQHCFFDKKCTQSAFLEQLTIKDKAILIFYYLSCFENVFF